MQITLQKLVLEDFKKHEYLEVPLGEMLTVIRGPNYSGKSTILQALFYCWFGPSAVPGGKSVVVRRGESNCKVTCYLNIQGEDFTIERTNTTAAVESTEEILVTGTSPVTAWVEEKLGFSYKSVMQMIYSEQSETASIMTLGAAALNRLIEEVSGVNYVEKCATKAKAHSDSWNTKLEMLGEGIDISDIEKDLEDHNASIAHYSDEEEKLAEEKLQLQDDRTNAQQALNEAIAHNEEATRREAQHTVAASRLEDATASLANIENKLKEIGPRPDYDSLAVASAKAYDICEAAESALRSLNRAKDSLEAKKGLLSDAEALKAKGDATLPEYTAAKKKYEKKDKEFQALLLTSQTITDTIARLQRSLTDGICPECNRPLDSDSEDHRKETLLQIEKVKGEKADLEIKHRSLASELNGLENNLSSLKRNLAPDDIEDQIAMLKESVSAVEVKIAEIEKENGDIETKLPELKSAAIAANDAATEAKHKAREFTRVQTELEECKDKIAESKKKLKEIKLLKPVNTDTLVTKRDELINKYNEVSDKLRSTESHLASMRQTVKELTAKVTEGKEHNKKISEASKQQKNFSGLSKWLRKSKEEFLQRLWDNILSYVSEFASMATDGDIEAVHRSQDGTFVFIENGEECPLAGASGGQKAIMGVGMRLALATLLPQGLSLVVLDEPSSELSDDKAVALAGALRAQGRQVVMVTHRTGEEFSSDQFISLE